MSDEGLCLWGSRFFFSIQYSIVLASFVEKMFLSPSNCLGAFVKNQLLKFSLSVDSMSCTIDLFVHLSANTPLLVTVALH